MRALWSGEVSFGLVSVPVKVYTATSSHDVPLHQVHDADGGRIRYDRRCEVCEQTVEYAAIDKAFEDGEQTVVLSKEDLRALPADTNHEIAVEQFVPEEQIDTLLLDKAYYLQPSSKSSKSYVLLRQSLEETARVAIVTFTLRSRTRLAALRVRDEVIVLQTLRWADELREPEFEIPDAKVTAKEREMAGSLVESYAEDFAPDRFSDDYQDQLRTLIAEKIEHGDAVDTDATFGDVSGKSDEDGDVVDLMEALKRSVDSRRSGGASDGETSGGQKGPKAGKKSSKNAPKKSAKKQTAKGSDTKAG